MSPRLDSESVRRTFGGVLIGTRRRLIPSPTTHLPSTSGRTSTRRTRSSPSLRSSPRQSASSSPFGTDPPRHRSSRIPSNPFNPFDPLIPLEPFTAHLVQNTAFVK
ncbi:hypothetical protein CROQUDRAFT_652913 [Cronartium quercuum f. sp. fusiforme G11]|uniref:Uncharacterized protein n=1 Tax=Cronartium quercuum f. sp. fusiforme G11 TaxID=708437 RepID=A0A9P6NMN1_9BASI|nr:hypothetical protein CROQUDRAFT_652913 [Cronartium quercuum f. sp. fusiforme G11]